MGADFSKVRFNPLLDYAGVELAQGRVLLDADVNELMAITDRGSRARTSDTLGRARVSSTTPDAFKITVAAGTLQIGRGRLYVDGLLAENHGAASTDPAKRVFDDLLGETSFADPVRYHAQPYLPSAPALSTVGRHLVYLDVWDREVTYLEQPGLIESAVGVDTSSRLQTVWQVRVLAENAGAGTTCGSPDADVPGWSTIIAPSTGVLSTGTFDVAPVDDPCELPPTGGFRGLENQLYRVEIHDAGQLGTGATFKWSRVDASVGSRVASVISGSELELETLGRDDVLRFNTGDWVEIIDDVQEFSQGPGVMRRITVIEATRRIQFTPALPAAMLPGSFPDSVFPGVHNWRVRLWDQKGRIFRTDAGGTPVQVQDLDAAGSTGVIAIPIAGTTLLLENGVTVGFASTGAKGFRAGDYWVFAARTADASVEILDRAPPRGIHHHYARLGLWDVAAGVVTDCRNHWPPRGDGGCCINVRPGESIQAAIDDLPPEGGCVCLKSGLHEIAAPLVITRENVSLHGESLGAIVQSQAAGALLNIAVLGGRGIRISSVTFMQSAASQSSGVMIFVDGTDGLVVHDCRLQSLAKNATGIGLFIARAENATVEGCSLVGCGVGIWLDGGCENVLIADSDIQIAAPARDTPVTVGILAGGASSGPTGPIVVERNRIAGAVSGIVINDSADEKPASLAAGSRVVDNRIDLVAAATEGGGFVFGIDVAAARGTVSGNHVTYGSNNRFGVAIRVTGDAGIVRGNILVSKAQQSIGIVAGFGDGDEFLPLERVIVTGNQVQGAPYGVLVLGAVRCIVSDNVLGGAIALVNADDCHVDGNVLTGPFAGISSQEGARNHILGNTIDRGAAGVLLSNETAPMISGNRVTGVSGGGIMVRDILQHCYIVENRLTNCGHGMDPARGIDALNVDGELHIEANDVMNTGVPLEPQEPAAKVAWGINAEHTLEARVESNVVSYSDSSLRPPTAEDRALRMRGREEHAFSPRIVTGFPVQITGNKFIGTGATALVELWQIEVNPAEFLRFERVLFSGNYCSHFVSGPFSSQAATVSLVGRHCTISGNHVKAAPDFPSYHFHGMPGPFIGNVSNAGNLGRTQQQEFPAPEANFNQRL